MITILAILGGFLAPFVAYTVGRGVADARWIAAACTSHVISHADGIFYVRRIDADGPDDGERAPQPLRVVGGGKHS